MEIIYEDVEVLVAVKPAGVESEEARGLEPDMVNLVRKHLAVGGKGLPYVGLIRRLESLSRGSCSLARRRLRRLHSRRN